MVQIQRFCDQGSCYKTPVHGKRRETRWECYLMAFAQTRVSKFKCAKQHVVDDVHHTIGS